MITHDRARTLVDCYNIETAEHLLHKYITQQEKKDELLELYKQYYNKIPIGTSMYKVEQQIEKLEKELEEK